PATCNELRAKYSNGTKGPEFGQYCPSRSEALGYMTGEGRMLIGYARVSKADGSQTTDLQRDALLAAGIDSEQIYEDQASGKQDDRPQLAACLKALRHGDTLIVWKLDRLGRDLRHLVNVVHDLTDRGVGLKVLTGQGALLTPPRPPANWCSGFLPL